MRAAFVVYLLALFFLTANRSVAQVDQADADSAQEIISEYMLLDHPEVDRLGEARLVRLSVLERLKAAPASAVSAISDAMPMANNHQRAELAEALRYFPSDESADVLISLLEDEDTTVRQQSVSILRLFSRRVDKSGFERRQHGKAREPLVEGLLPHLIEASQDMDATVRMSAIYAMADSTMDEAVPALRSCLMDENEKNRLKAACLLTEFGDHAGKEIITASLARLRDPGDPLRYLEAGLVIVSLERITGKSFGPIPPCPLILSDSRQILDAESKLDTLLARWDEHCNSD